jgi:hypothetical protein
LTASTNGKRFMEKRGRTKKEGWREEEGEGRGVEKRRRERKEKKAEE